MNPHLRGALARSLWNRRAELLSAVAETEDDLRSLEQDHQNELEERAQDATAARLLALLSEQERREIDDIDAAIRRLVDGTYGRCEVCGRSIPVERLRALPAARLCIDCERTEERGDVSSVARAEPLP